MNIFDGELSATKILVNDNKIISNVFLPPNINRRYEGGLRKKMLFKRSYLLKPLISIITVVHNGENYLEQTINSVLKQNFDNVEYIIIDGGSTDKTVDIIKKYDYAIDYWVSESDSGIYNAMNKGASLCRGEYVAYLNADDWYANNTFDLVLSVIKKEKVDYIFGNVFMMDYINKSWVYFPKIKEYKYRMPLPHPGLFVKKKHLLYLGFDESYKAISDYDFIIRLLNITSLKYTYVDSIFTYFRVGGTSASAHEIEHFRLAYLNFGLAMAVKKFFFRTKKYHMFLPKRIINKFYRMFFSF